MTNAEIKRNEVKEAKYQWLVNYAEQGKMTSPICDGNKVIGWNYETIERNLGFETKEQAEKYARLLNSNKEEAHKFYKETRVPPANEPNPYELFPDLK